MSVTSEDNSKAVWRAGLGGRPVSVHSSLRSFGWVEGGAEAVVSGLLDILCWSTGLRYCCPPPRQCVLS
jgi:aminoglycoside N3'-acetyltransferase